MAVLYRHIRLDTNTPFYVGIGQDEKRAYDKHHRNDHWKRIVKKHGYKVHIMMNDLTWDEAQQKEREFIQLYGRKDLGLGTLVNMTDGGDGVLGRICSEETIAKMSAAQTGKPKSEEHVAKVSAALTGRKQSEEHIAKRAIAKTGKKQSEETKAKRSVTLTGRVFTKEWKANLSAAKIGKPKPPRTAEHNANIGAAKKAWWAERKQKNQ